MEIYDTFANKHPTTFLTNFLQVNMGCMDWSTVTREIPTIDGRKPSIIAVIMIHSQVVADYKTESSRYAKVGAAKKAMELLKGLPLPEFRERYRCDCRIEETEAEDHFHGTAI
jgi:endoribonuclease Dicer